MAIPRHQRETLRRIGTAVVSDVLDVADAVVVEPELVEDVCGRGVEVADGQAAKRETLASGSSLGEVRGSAESI